MQCTCMCYIHGNHMVGQASLQSLDSTYYLSTMCRLSGTQLCIQGAPELNQCSLNTHMYICNMSIRTFAYMFVRVCLYCILWTHMHMYMCVPNTDIRIHVPSYNFVGGMFVLYSTGYSSRKKPNHCAS